MKSKNKAAVWIKDGHWWILTEGNHVSKNLHPFFEYEYLRA